MRYGLALVLLGACQDELSFGRYLVDGGSLSCGTEGAAFAVGDGDPGCRDVGFHHALCSCGDYVSSSTTTSEGSLGVGGGLSAGSLQIGGSLIVSGQQGIPLTGDLQVDGSLHDQGQLQGNHEVRVAGDAHIAGPVRLDTLRVGKVLTLDPASALEIRDGAPTAVRAPITIPPPCDCTPMLDVAAQVAAARADNDNAAIALEPMLGLRTFDSPRTLELPCGRYYVDQIYAAQPITLNVRGRVALFVENRIVTEQAGGLRITLAPGAELDLFLRQGFTGAGPIELGERARPHATRIYVEGGDSLFFSAQVTIAASLYAPRSELVSQRDFELYGAALLARVAVEAPMRLHHDPTLGASCTR